MDIMLKETFKGQYDRVHGFNDFKTVHGDEELENRIIHHLMTRSGELSSIPYYESFGCGVWSYLKNNNTTLTQMNAQELIKETLQKIKHAKHVDVESNPSNPHSLNIFFSIETMEGCEIDGKL